MLFKQKIRLSRAMTSCRKAVNSIKGYFEMKDNQGITDMELKDETWIWVVIENPEKNEKIVGQRGKKGNIPFIPVYKSKEEAMQCMNLLARKPGSIYEAQAILYEDVKKYAAENGFMIFLLDGSGTVIEKITL